MNQEVRAIRRHKKIEEWTLILVVVVSLIGVAITNFDPIESYRYWLLTAVFYALAGMVISVSKQRRDQVLKMPLTNRLIDQLILWCGVFFAVMSIYVIVKIGRINYEAAGFVVLLILGLGVFTDGIRFSWRFSMIGMLMMLSAVIAAYIVAYVWLILGGIVLAVVVAYWLEHLNYKVLLKRFEVPKKEDIEAVQHEA